MHSISAKRLGDLCGIPEKDNEFLIVTEKAFNAYACVKQLLSEGSEIDELYLAIYRINSPIVEGLCEMITSGRIKKATFIISSFFNQTKKPEQWSVQLKEFCKNNPDRTEFCYLHNHSKILLARKGDNYYYFEGSGNMSDNARIEQYRYGNCKQIYDFHQEWMERLINEVKTR